LNDFERSDPVILVDLRPQNLKKNFFYNLSTLYLNGFLFQCLNDFEEQSDDQAFNNVTQIYRILQIFFL